MAPNVRIYCQYALHIVGIVRRYSFSKKSKKFIIFLDNIKLVCYL